MKSGWPSGQRFKLASMGTRIRSQSKSKLSTKLSIARLCKLNLKLNSRCPVPPMNSIEIFQHFEGERYSGEAERDPRASRLHSYGCHPASAHPQLRHSTRHETFHGRHRQRVGHLRRCYRVSTSLLLHFFIFSFQFQLLTIICCCCCC